MIRVAIAGQGRSGHPIHYGVLTNRFREQFQVVAVADQIKSRTQEAAAEVGARTYSDYSSMINDGGFDLLINALPPIHHVPATVQALASGFHVVCEKPIAATVADLDLMEKEAISSGRHLIPVQNNRPQPFFRKIREVLDSGVLGKTLLVQSYWGSFRRRWDWQVFQANHGGALFNTGPHAIDHALILFGEQSEPDVFCRMDCNNPFGGDADDQCLVTLFDKQRKAPVVEVLISQYLAYSPNRYNICGTHGGLSGDETQLNWRYFLPEEAPKQALWDRWSVDRTYPDETLPWREEAWSLPKRDDMGAVGYTIQSFLSGVKLFYDNVYEVIECGGNLEFTVAQSRRQLQVLEECLRQNPLPIKRDVPTQ